MRMFGVGRKVLQTLPPVAPSLRPPKGWYANPEGPGQRWWDGEAWSELVWADSPTVGPLLPTVVDEIGENEVPSGS